MCYGAHLCCMHMMTDKRLPAGASGRSCQPAAYLPDVMQELALLKRLPLLPLRDTRYLWRRALRILPAFYSALALGRLLAVPLARHPSVPEEVRRAPAVALLVVACQRGTVESMEKALLAPHSLCTHCVTWPHLRIGNVHLCVIVFSPQTLTSGAPRARDAFFTEVPFATEQCGRNMWATLALVHNARPMGGCYSTTWSLAVQAQFYVGFPALLVLLRPRAPGFRRVSAAP